MIRKPILYRIGFSAISQSFTLYLQEGCENVEKQLYYISHFLANFLLK